MKGIAMEKCMPIHKRDLPGALKIAGEYLPGYSADEIAAMYREYPTAAVGYYIDGRLIGFCFGRPSGKNHFQLCGIAIVSPNNQCGRGGKLLKAFEENAAALGYGTVSLGSAGGYVERFYIKNGYTPVEFKVLSRKLPEGCNMDRVETEGTDYKLVKIIGDYSSLNREEIIQRCKGYHSFIVFEKRL